jgi:phosphoglycerate dehydrogenase-like enzyme
MPVLTIVSRDASKYGALIEQSSITDLTTHIYEATEFMSTEAFESNIVLADPSLIMEILGKFTALQWMQSTWAGNAPLLQAPKYNYKLTGVKGVFGDYMREFVLGYMLYFSRNISGFAEHQAQQNWQPAHFNQLKNKTLGLLGVGSIGEAVAETAKHFGMQVVGITRNNHTSRYVDTFYTNKEKCQLAQEADYIVSILPDTPDTQNFIDVAFLENLKPDCVLINVGRGSVINDEALIQALSNKQLKAAVLDVFEQEPLPQDHPYWLLPNVFITNHTAAVSYPEDIFRIFHQNYNRFINQEPLMYELSFENGY